MHPRSVTRNRTYVPDRGTPRAGPAPHQLAAGDRPWAAGSGRDESHPLVAWLPDPRPSLVAPPETYALRLNPRPRISKLLSATLALADPFLLAGSRAQAAFSCAWHLSSLSVARAAFCSPLALCAGEGSGV